MQIYLSGAIAADPDYKAKFNLWACTLATMGHSVLSPTRHPEGLTKAQYMHLAFADIDAADAVFVLPDEHISPGGDIEQAYARYVGKRVCYRLVDLEG